MIELVLERGYTYQGTFGELYMKEDCKAPKFLCYTLERPWMNNERNRSCIPEGTYDIDFHRGTKWHDSLIIHDDQYVEKYNGSHDKRWGILFHPENHPLNLQGCIAPVSSFGVLNGKWAGLGSKKAMSFLLEAVRANDIGIISIGGKEAWI